MNLKQTIQSIFQRIYRKQYYNNKYPKVNLTYSRTDKYNTFKIDVRQFLNKNNFFLPELKGTDDKKALKGLKWIIENIAYNSDYKQYKQNEYWAFGYETFKRRQGDCEDGAILLYDILSKNKIPIWKLRVNAGWVKNPYTGKRGGHAYLTYFYEKENRWIILDWCYFPNLKPIKDRIEYKQNKIYKDVWFSFNEKYSWSKGLNENEQI